jgi:branched-subunit amino acid ABC-type transport system permease component
VLGGMGSIGGALAAGVFMITVQDIVSVIWGPVWSSLTFFVILVIVLSFRPQGIFGKQEARLA